MALDVFGVTASLASYCPLDGVGGPYPVSGTNIYPDGNGVFWRLDFSGSSTTAQQQAAINALATLTSYTPPTSSSLTPYRLTGSYTFGSLLAIGTATKSVSVPGLLKTDAPMISFGVALPTGVNVPAVFPDKTQDGVLVLEIAVVSLLSGSTVVPFTLVGLR